MDKYSYSDIFRDCILYLEGATSRGDKLSQSSLVKVPIRRILQRQFCLYEDSGYWKYDRGEGVWLGKNAYVGDEVVLNINQKDEVRKVEIVQKADEHIMHDHRRNKSAITKSRGMEL